MSAQWNPGIWNPRTGSTPNSYLYRAEQYDSDLGLYYLRARYYNPLTGRFLSRDPDDHSPMDPNQLHKYLYAGGDPVNMIDPTGRGDAGVTYALILTTIRTITVPAVVAFAGEYVTLQAIPWIVSTGVLVEDAAALARVVGVFVADAAATHAAKGLAKLYVCYELGSLYISLNLDFDKVNIPDNEKKEYEGLAHTAFVWACEHYMWQ